MPGHRSGQRRRRRSQGFWRTQRPGADPRERVAPIRSLQLGHRVQPGKGTELTMPELAVVVRAEESRDAEGVRTVNEQAFGRPNEAPLVDALRGLPQSISLFRPAR